MAAAKRKSADTVAPASTPVTSEAVRAAFDLDSIMAQASKKSTPGKKPSAIEDVTARAIATLIASGKEPKEAEAQVRKDVADFLTAHRQEAAAKAEKGAAASKLIAYAGPARFELIAGKGFVSSVKLSSQPDPRGNAPQATCTWTNAYSAVPKEDETSVTFLQEKSGENFSRWFASALTLKVRDPNNETVQQELVAALGIERFIALFEATRVFEATDVYHLERATDFDAAKRATFDAVVRPNAPSVKPS